MDADDCSSSSDLLSDSETCLEEIEDEELFYSPGSIPKLQFRKGLIKTCWKDEMNMAEVLEIKGRILTTMGIIRNAKIYLNIEETLFLAEVGAQCLVDDKYASIPLKNIYEKMADGRCGCCWEAFEIYRHLKSLGFIVGRHGVPWSLKNVKCCLISSQCPPEKDGESHGGLEEIICINELFKGFQIGEEKPLFDVYLPNSKFRKSSPGVPSFIFCLARNAPPSRGEIENLERQCNGIPLRFGRVDNGRISFFSINRVELPVLP